MEGSQPELLAVVPSSVSQSLLVRGSWPLHEDEDTVTTLIAEKEPHLSMRMRLKSFISVLSPTPQLDELPRVKPKGSPASLRYHRGSQQDLGLPALTVSPAPPTSSFARASSGSALSSSAVFALSSITKLPPPPPSPTRPSPRRSPAHPPYPCSRRPPTQVQVRTPTPTQSLPSARCIAEPRASP
ncbi:hypothetical protein FIBSPDRAFT_1043434 [Athelia psychrophila]|uniref:Uncharacterized protein n=1 Tax=Athelia psychrophila TaxID=1759441 RepID=A0A166L409_9AGAM|nr:hypothetical protein FIBSPDRAFT_1043434 [Fibularhizoctonia sp. CBS 109695]